MQHYRWRRGALLRGTPRRERVMIETYRYLRRLGDLPLSVIQSTRDDYLPAAAARQLFGPDTPNRRFHAIEARNHSFKGAQDRLYAEVRDSLAWICGLHPGGAVGGPGQ